MDKFLKTAVNAADSKKAKNIKVIDISEKTSVADFFIICSGSSTTQVKAIADECEEKLEEQGFELLHREGRTAGNWILLDYGEYVIHVYSDEMREFYSLERLWSDGKDIDIKDFLGSEADEL